MYHHTVPDVRPLSSKTWRADETAELLKVRPISYEDNFHESLEQLVENDEVYALFNIWRHYVERRWFAPVTGLSYCVLFGFPVKILEHIKNCAKITEKSVDNYTNMRIPHYLGHYVSTERGIDAMGWVHKNFPVLFETDPSFYFPKFSPYRGRLTEIFCT